MRDTHVRKYVNQRKEEKKKESGAVEKFDGRKEAGLRPRDFVASPFDYLSPSHSPLHLFSPEPGGPAYQDALPCLKDGVHCMYRRSTF